MAPIQPKMITECCRSLSWLLGSKATEHYESRMLMRKTAVGIVLVILVAAGLGVGYLTESASRQTVSSSSTTSTVTPSGGISTNGSGGFHYVTFYDSGPCGANSTWGAHFVEWGVQLGNETRTEPSNITLSQIPEDGSYGADRSFNMTRIVFLVPSGTYPFTLYPTALMRVGSPNGTVLAGPTGVINVTNSDVSVYTAAVAFSAECEQ